MLGTCEALKSDASEIAAFASQPLCINYQVISERIQQYTHTSYRNAVRYTGERPYCINKGQMGCFRVPQVCLKLSNSSLTRQAKTSCDCWG